MKHWGAQGDRYICLAGPFPCFTAIHFSTQIIRVNNREVVWLDLVCFIVSLYLYVTCRSSTLVQYWCNDSQFIHIYGTCSVGKPVGMFGAVRRYEWHKFVILIFACDHSRILLLYYVASEWATTWIFICLYRTQLSVIGIKSVFIICIMYSKASLPHKWQKASNFLLLLFHPTNWPPNNGSFVRSQIYIHTFRFNDMHEWKTPRRDD